MDDYGLPVRHYETVESQMAEAILRKVFAQKISQWLEEYYDYLKESDCALEHGLNAMDVMVRYMSNLVFDMEEGLRKQFSDISLDFGTLDYLTKKMTCDNILTILQRGIFGSSSKRY